MRACVVVPSHGRALRLRWLLNALADQTLAPEDWEVVVVHDYDRETAARVIGSHPLAEAGRLREVAAGPGNPARQRNLGWRATEAPLLAFTDDDCRPAADWLARLVEAAERRPRAFVQGLTIPDQFERDLFAAPHVHTLRVEPPNLGCETCNALYPRELLEALGGFDEDAIVGEDMDLAVRARRAGREHVAVPGAVVHHAVQALTVPGFVRRAARFRHMARQVARHPEVRRSLVLGAFWDAGHLRAALLAAGALGRRRARVLALPWLVAQAGRRGSRPVDVAVNLLELPGRAALEVAEVLIYLAGSVEHRTVVL